MASLQLPVDVESWRASGSSSTCSASSPAGSRSPAPSRRRRRCCSTCSSRSSRRRASSRSTRTTSSRRRTRSGARSSAATTRRSRLEGPSRPTAVDGTALWETNPDLYLAIAKVEPLNRALLDLDCWITGIRRDQSPTRADAPKLGWDEQHELWKANPLADWTDERLLGVHPRARAAVQRAPRPGLRRRSATRTRRCPARAARAAGPAPSRTECGLPRDA